MNDASKESEVRARIPNSMFEALSVIAHDRHEKMPVIVREALTEYLARRAATAGSHTPESGALELIQALRDQPDLTAALVRIGRALDISSAPAVTAAGAIVQAGADVAQAAPAAQQSADTPVKYTIPRSSKNVKPPEPDP